MKISTNRIQTNKKKRDYYNNIRYDKQGVTIDNIKNVNVFMKVEEINEAKIKDFLDFTKETNIFKAYKENELPVVNRDDRQKILENLFYDFGTDKRSTPQALMYKAIEVDRQYNHTKTGVKNASRNIKRMIDDYSKLDQSGTHIAYDLETLGGDLITEFSFTLRDNGTNGIVNAGSPYELTNIIGIHRGSEDDTRISKIINRFESSGTVDPNDKILLQRLHYIGSDDTVIQNIAPGHHITKSAQHENIKRLNVDNIKKGYEKLLNVGEEQKRNVGSDGLMLWQRQLLAAVNEINNGIPTVTQNGTMADSKWINTYINKMYKNMNGGSKQAVDKILNRTSGDFIRVNDTTNIDTLAILRAHSQLFPKYNLYSNKSVINALDTSSTLSQEALNKAILGGSGDMAHTAFYDSEVSSKIATSGHLKQAISDLRSMDTGMTLKPNEQLVFTTNGFFNVPTYSYDKNRGIIKSNDGYFLDLNNNSVSREVGGFGINKNRAYYLGDIDEVELNDELFESINKSHGFTNKKVFKVKMNTVDVRDGETVINDNPLIMLFNSIDELENAFSSSTHIIAEKDAQGVFQDIKGPYADAMKEDLAYVNGQYFGHQNLIIRSNNKIKNARAARKLGTDYKYDNYKQFEEFYKELQQASGYKTINNAEAARIISEAVLQSGNTSVNKMSALDIMSLALSNDVSKGEPILMNFFDIQDALGFKQRGSEEKTLLSSTLDNIQDSFEIFYRNMKISEKIDSRMSMAGVDESNKSAVYQHVRNTLLDYADINTKKGAKGSGLLKSEAMGIFELYSNELNSKLKREFLKINSTGTNTNNIFKINLKGSEHTLIEDLIKNFSSTRNFPTGISEQKNNAVKPILNVLIEDIYSTLISGANQKGNETYKNIMKNTATDIKNNAMDKDNPYLIAEYILNSLRGLKENGSDIGIIRNYDNDIESKIRFLMKEDNNVINSLIDDSIQNTPKTVTYTKAEKKKFVDSFIAKKMPSIKEAEKISQSGFDQVEKTLISTIDNLNREVYKNNVSNLLNVSGKNGVDLIEQNGLMFAVHNNQFFELQMPVIRHTKAGDVLRIGNMDVTNNLVVNGYNAINMDASEVYGNKAMKKMFNFTTTMGSAYSKAGNIERYVENAIKNGDSPAKGIESYYKKVSEYIREFSSVGNKDIVDGTSFRKINYQDVVSAMPNLIKNGFFKGKEHKFIDDEEQTFYKLITGQRRFNPKSVGSDLMAAIQNNSPIILRELFGDSDDENIRAIAASINTNVKATHGTKFIAGVGSVANQPLSQFSRSARDNMHQGRYKAYDKSVWEKSAAKISNDVILNNIISNPFDIANDEYMSEAGVKYSSKINVRNLSSSTLSFKRKIADSAIDNEIKEYVSNLSLSEGEILLSNEIMDGFFYSTQNQRLNSRLELTTNITKDLGTLNQLDRIKKIQPSVRINKKGEISFGYMSELVDRGDPIAKYFRYGGEEAVQGAKFKGRLKTIYTDENGYELSESQITNFLNANRSKIKTTDDAVKLLDDNFSKSLTLDSIFKQDFKKVSHGMEEKSMGRTIYVGMGHIDKTIESKLRDMGMSDYVGTVLKDEEIDLLLEGRFIKDSTFDSYLNFKSAILKEQHAVSEAIFGKNGVLDSNGSSAKMVSYINSNKHKSRITILESLVSGMTALNMNKNGLTKDEAVKKTFEDLGGENGLFKIQGVKYENGRIIVPDIAKDGKDALDIKYLINALESNDHYKEILDITDKGIVVGKKIEELGYENFLKISESYDHELISSSNPYDNESIGKLNLMLDAQYEKRRTARKLLKNERRKERKGGHVNYDDISDLIDDIREYDVQIETIKERIRDHKSAYGSVKKVKQLDLRSDLILTGMKYDQNSIDAVRKTYEENGGYGTSVFNDIFDDVLNGDGTLKAEYKGKKVLSDYQEKLSKAALYDIYGGDTDITDAVLKSANTEDYKNFLEKAKARGFSKERADLGYSIINGTLASDFNEGNLSKDEMLKRGFKALSLENVNTSTQMGAEAIKTSDNIFDSNMVLEYIDQDGKIQNIAMPAMPYRQTGDAVVKYNVQAKLSSVKNKYIEANELMNNGTMEERIAAWEKFDTALEEYKSELNYSIGGKEGLKAEASKVTLRDSALAKASRANVLDINKDFEIYTGDMNDKVFKKAMINNHTILENADAGRYYDFVTFSEDIAKDLGYFTDEYMESVGISVGSYDERKQKMIELLSTKGNIFMASRDPNFKESSSVLAHGFLDTTLGSNTIKVAAESHIAMAGDVDGDTSGIRHHVIEGYDYLQALHAGEEDVFNSSKRQMELRAATVNKSYHAMAKDELETEMNRALSGENYNISSLYEGGLIEGKHYAGNSATISGEEIANNKRIVSEFSEKYGVDFSSLEGKGKEAYENIDEALAAVRSNEGEDAYKRYSSAVISHLTSNQERLDTLARARKGAIGEANIPLLKLRNINSMFLEDNNNSRVMQIVSENIEQEIISSKNLTTVVDVWDKSIKFSKAFNSALFGDNAKVRERGSEELTAWLNENLDNAMDKMNSVLKSTNNDVDLSKEEIVSTFMNNINRYAESDEIRTIRDHVSMGTKNTGITTEELRNGLKTIPLQDDTPYGTFMKALADISDDVEVIDYGDIKKSASAIVDDSETIATRSLADGTEWTNKKGVFSKFISTTGEAFSEMASDFSGKHLAMGMVGIAGLYMAAGLTGGNPSVPADIQAQQSYRQEEMQTLHDNEIAYSQSNGKTGYVMNISANTNRDKRHTTGAIKNAVGSNYNGNTNMSININENVGNITDRDIEQMISGAFS